MTNAAPILTKNPIYRFRNLGNAESWVHHGVKPQWIMLGDDETFWVATPADASRLECPGYDYATSPVN